MSTNDKDMIAFQERLIRTGQWRTCINCEYWTEIPNSNRTMICGKWGQTPPLEVIVVGCPEWIDRIPF